MRQKTPLAPWRTGMHWLATKLPLARLRWFLVAGGVMCGIGAGVWWLVVAPALLKMPDDFTYQAEIVSYDNFFDTQTNGYSGEVLSNTKFGYNTVRREADGTLLVKNLFDVRQPNGEQIFSVARTYGIDSATGSHVAGYGDHARSGYLFAPRHLTKQPFEYWHVNYDSPAHMEFQAEENVLGVDTYRYLATFSADQTSDLMRLPGVGVTKGITLDITLQLWLEPTTGYLVKYEDRTTAYYYDLATKQRLAPWNSFRNRYNFSSVASHAQAASQARQKTLWVESGIPSVLAALAIVLTVLGLVAFQPSRLATRRLALYVLTGVSVGAALLSLTFWVFAGNGALVPDWIAPMYPGAALCVLFLSVVIWMLATRPQLGKTQRVLVVVAGLTLLTGLLVVTWLPLQGVLVQNIALFGQPLILPNGLLYCGALVLAVVVACLSPGSRMLRFVREALVVGVGLAATASVFAYVFGPEAFGYDWLHNIVLSAAVIVLFQVVALCSLEPQWYTSRLLKRLSKGAWLFWLVSLCMLLVTGAVWQIATESVIRQNKLQFQSDVNDLHGLVADRLATYIAGLQGGQGLFAASQDVTREEWAAYVAGLRLGQNFPGLQGLGFAEVVPVSQLDAHTAKLRSQGSLQYEVTPRQSQNDAYTPVTFLEPLDARNQRALGYDMFSEPVRRAAITQARDTGQPVMSGKVTLRQETDADVQAGFLVYAPVYAKNAPVTTVAERQAAILGFVYSPFRMGDFMRATIGERLAGIEVSVFDGTERDASALMYSSTQQPAPYPRHIQSQSLQLAGRQWTFHYASSATYDVGLAESLPGFVLYGGVTLSLMLGLLAFALGSSRQRALVYAAQATTDLVQQKNQAVSLQHKAEAIIDGVSEGLMVVNKNGAIEHINDSALAMLGFTKKELLNHHYAEAIIVLNDKGQAVPEHERPIGRVLAKGMVAHESDLFYRCKNGEVISVQLSVAPVKLLSKTVGAIEIFRDTTKERELERAKDEFVSLASHQLRTPLTAVRLFSEMLLQQKMGRLNQKQLGYVRNTYESTLRMLGLINGFLNISRLELGSLEVKPETIDLVKVLHQYVENMQPLAWEYGVTVVMTTPATTNITTKLDLIMLEQVVINILTNAVHYAPKKTGRVELSVQKQANHIEIIVKDNGIGIPDDAKKHVFERFYRAENAIAHRGEGSGLGLYLIKRVLGMVGGTIRFAKNQTGPGTTFYVTLPAKGMSAVAGEKQLTEAEYK